MAANVYNQITDLSAVITFGRPNEDNLFDVDLQNGASAILLQAEGQNIRWRADGTDPTGSVGMQLIAGDAPIRLDIQTITQLKLIEDAAGAILNYHFIGE